MKGYIVSILHAMIMTHDLPHRINHKIQKDIVGTLCSMNLLCDVLRLYHTNTKSLSPSHSLSNHLTSVNRQLLERESSKDKANARKEEVENKLYLSKILPTFESRKANKCGHIALGLN